MGLQKRGWKRGNMAEAESIRFDNFPEEELNVGMAFSIWVNFGIYNCRWKSVASVGRMIIQSFCLLVIYPDYLQNWIQGNYNV